MLLFVCSTIHFIDARGLHKKDHRVLERDCGSVLRAVCCCDSVRCVPHHVFPPE